MHRRRFRLEVEAPLEHAHAALVAVHWPRLEVDARLRPGLRFTRREGRVEYRGRIIDCQPPLRLTLRELLLAPWPVLRMYARYSLEPARTGTLVLVEWRLTLFAPGRVAPWLWVARATEEAHYRLRRARVNAEFAAERALRGHGAAPRAAGAATP